MLHEHKQKLIKLGSEKISETLLNYAYYSDEANELVELLVSTPQENIQRYKDKIAELKDSNRYIEWHQSSDFADELKRLLFILEYSVDDPDIGLDLIVIFFETDEVVFEICLDTGYVNIVFESYAKNLFVKYALGCQDKEKVINNIIKLVTNDNYGIRDILLESASQCLSKEHIYTFITKLKYLSSEHENNDYKKDYLRFIKSLASQIKDEKLYEEVCIEINGYISSDELAEMAKMSISQNT